MVMIQDGSLITWSTKLTFSSFFKYPAKFFIQFFTKSKVEHVGIALDGYIYEATLAKGVGKTKIEERKIYKYSDVRVYQLCKKLVKTQANCLRADLEAVLGKKYGIRRAIYSAFDQYLPSFLQIPNKNKKFFCSKLVYIAYRKLGLLPYYNPNTITPQELIEICKRHNVIDQSKDFRELIKSGDGKKG
jgi:hypothetical protein